MSGHRQFSPTTPAAIALAVFGSLVITLGVACGTHGRDVAGRAAASPGAITTVTESNFDTEDECLQPQAINSKIAGNRLVPALDGFDAKLPGDGFTLERAYFATIGPCNPDAGKRVFRTIWRHRATGLLMYLEEDQRAAPASALLSTTGAFFTSGGMSFYLTTGHDMVVDPTGRAGPLSRPANPDRADVKQQQDVMREAIDHLAPKSVRDCLAVERLGSSWKDLKSYGISDPSSAIPDGYTPIHFALTFVDTPACNPAPQPQPAFTLDAKWEAPGNRLLGIHIVAGSHGATVTSQAPGHLAWSTASWSATVDGDPDMPVQAVAEAIGFRA